MFNLSCYAGAPQSTIMEIGPTQTLSSVVKQPSRECKYWAASALCNLSWNLDYAQRLVLEGAVSVLRELLATADMDPNDPIYLQCVTALYNMAQCSGKINEKLVR